MQKRFTAPGTAKCTCKELCLAQWIVSHSCDCLKGDVTRDDSRRRFLEQHSVATLLPHCFEWLQHCSNIATLCCAKNRCCESSFLIFSRLPSSFSRAPLINRRPAKQDIKRRTWFGMVTFITNFYTSPSSVKERVTKGTL